MLANQRRDKILDLLKEDGAAKVLNLARLFKVTEVTIRQDLEKLEKDGLIIREHGGAYIEKHKRPSADLFTCTPGEHGQERKDCFKMS